VKSENRRNIGTRSLRSTILGTAFRATGNIAILASLAGLIVLQQSYRGSVAAWEGVYLYALLAAAALFYWGKRLDILGRRHLSRILHVPELLYDEPFVLYLRAFNNDLELAKRELKFWKAIGASRARQSLFDSALTDEEQIVQALAPVGLVVAAGRPGEKVPRAGALRMYLTKESWEGVILDLMEHAHLVVLGVGSGHKLAWEFFQAVQIVHPHRLVILVTHKEKRYYENFRNSVGAYFDSAVRKDGEQVGRDLKSTVVCRLPDPPPPERWSLYDTSKGWIIFFDCNWVAKQTILSSPRPQRNRFRRMFSESMEPVFQRISEMESDDHDLSLPTKQVLLFN
jgi:hypothetical protein